MIVDLIALIASSVLAGYAVYQLTVRRALERSLAESERERAELRRAVRLAGVDLSDAALRLHGQAGALRGSGDATNAAALAALAERCSMLVEDLAGAGETPGTPALREETIDLLACVQDAVAGIEATIAPGRRHFRLRPPPAPRWVWADRRAVRQAVGRVLGEATLSTRHDDNITVSLELTDEGSLALVVEDEGSGLAAPVSDAAGAPVRDSRGIGGRLALCRGLMEAHGGRLDVLAALGAGTRVGLVFPAARVRMGGAAA
jgi:two-component system OmpR family sensor kinase